MVPRDNPAFGIYVHIPFCISKCAYCDFVSYPHSESFFGDYVQALIVEARQRRSHWAGVADTLFIGGGTPTVLPGVQLSELIVELCKLYAIGEDAEITVEANPGTIEKGDLERLRRAGVTRLSLGVQSFRNDELSRLGRIHSAEEARQAFQYARSAGFDNINLDLIFGLPWQTVAHWQLSLRQAIGLKPEHLSLYALTIESGTPLADHIDDGSVPQPDDELAAAMYELAEAELDGAGYVHYEISNWARGTPSDTESRPQLACRHNLRYWHNEPYLGLGVAAYSYDGLERFGNTSGLDRYIELIRQGQDARDQVERTDPSRQMDETMMLGLRLMAGISWQVWRERFDTEARQVYGPQIESLEEMGLLAVDTSGMRLTPRGRLLGNRVFAEFLRD